MRRETRRETRHNNSLPTKKLRLDWVGVRVGYRLRLGWVGWCNNQIFTNKTDSDNANANANNTDNDNDDGKDR